MRPSIQRLREVLDYNPETGVFVWRIALNGRVPIGTIAGVVHHRGYRWISVDRHRIPASHIAWAMIHGAWPRNQIDHINRNRGDDRFVNLREATNAQNCRNRKVRTESSTGIKGVTRHGRGFQAMIQADGVNYYLGKFKEMKHAIACYRIAAAGLHGEFAAIE